MIITCHESRAKYQAFLQFIFSQHANIYFTFELSGVADETRFIFAKKVSQKKPLW